MANDELTNKRLIEDYCKVADLSETSDPPSTTQYLEFGEHSPCAVNARFDSWNAFVLAAGFEPRTQDRSDIDITRGNIIEDFQRVASLNQTDETPTVDQYNEHGKTSAQTASKLFGTWNDLVRAAGFDPTVRRDIQTEELVEDYRRVASLAGTSDTPTRAEYEEYGEFSSSTVKSRSGSWNQFLKHCGFDPTQRYDITNKELIEDYKRVASLDKTTAVPTIDEYRTHGNFASRTISLRFEKWHSFVEASGFNAAYARYIPDLSGTVASLRSELYRGLETNFKTEDSPKAQADHNSCGWCGKSPADSLHTHHIIPAVWGSSNHEQMLLPLCRVCHTKADRYMSRELSEFATIPHLLREEQETISNTFPVPTADRKHATQSSLSAFVVSSDD